MTKRNGSPFLAAGRLLVFLFAAGVFIGSLIWSYQLTNIYVQYPRVPDAKVGKVFPYDVKGTIVYVTKGQMDQIVMIRATEIIGGIVFFLSIAAFRFFPMKPKDEKR
jgi:hypothetical protein